MTTVRFAAGKLTFEWHAAKAATNQRKHGVSFEEAATVFLDPRARLFDEPDRADAEDRFLIVGRSEARRLLFVVHVERGDRLRLIGARLATRSERAQMEEGT